jgi:hypothetical protein
MKMRLAALVVALGLGACADNPTAPSAMAGERPALQARGTGLELSSVTGLTVPLLGVELGDVVIEQAVITNFALVENLVGQIVGVEVEGLLQLTGGVLGTDVLTEDFSTLVSVTSSGPGQCDVITIDLAPISVDILGRVAFVDVPVASVTGRGSGAVGSLLCALGRLLSGPLGGVISGVRGIVNALNNLI